MNINKSIVQKALRRNATTITYLQVDLKLAKEAKAYYDVDGNEREEYYFHEVIKATKKTIKDLVSEQLMLKQLMKGN